MCWQRSSAPLNACNCRWLHCSSARKKWPGSSKPSKKKHLRLIIETAGNKKPRTAQLLAVFFSLESATRQCSDHIFGLQPFVTIHDRELHALAFNQYTVTFATNGPEMHENIIAGITGNKAEAFGGVEPLDGAGIAVAHVVAWRGGGRRGFVEADSQVQENGDQCSHQAEQDGRLTGDDRHRREQRQGLQDDGQDQQGADQVLQLVTRTFVPVRDNRSEGD